jgi:hypothetical protein
MRLNDHRRHVAVHGTIEIRDESTIERHADDRGEKALRHTERHVHSARVTPFGYDVAAPDYHSRRIAARLEGTDRVAERLSAERLNVGEQQVAGRLRFVRDSEGDSRREPRRVHADLSRTATLPASVGRNVRAALRPGLRVNITYRRTCGDRDDGEKKRAAGPMDYHLNQTLPRVLRVNNRPCIDKANARPFESPEFGADLDD